MTAGNEHVDVVVVGSGFGGSVSAYRLAAGGLRVVLLERGRSYPPGSFARTPHDLGEAFWDPRSGNFGLFDVWSFTGLEGVVSSGLGGGSLIYANVLLRKDEKWFILDDVDGESSDGPREWPVTRADLEPHYDEVERMLTPQRFPVGARGYQSSGKTELMRDAARRLGLEWELPPLAVTFAVGERPEPGVAIPPPEYGNLFGRPRTTCQLCGECDLGCNFGSKNTLDHTYLSAAAHHGADLRTHCEVQSFEPTPSGWAVHYCRYDPDARQPVDIPGTAITTITCDRLILAAGTFGTTYLLLRNRSALPGLSRTLGHRFSGNGDLLGFVLDARTSDGNATRFGSTGAPVITSTVRVPDTLDGGSGRGYYVQDAGYPGFVDWLLEGTNLPGSVRRIADTILDWTVAQLLNRRRSEIGTRLSELLGPGDRSTGSMPLLGMGRDIPDGVMHLRDGWLDIDWSIRSSAEYLNRVRTTMSGLAHEFGGRFEPNPLSWLQRVVTVHPLGGAPMGRSAAEGVVDSYGEVFGNPGLFAVDGSVMPGPVGANPSLTIAAFADRAATAILEGRSGTLRAPWAQRTGGRRPAPDPTSVSFPTADAQIRSGVSFQLSVRGFVGLTESDPVDGLARGRADHAHCALHLTVPLDLLGRLQTDPAHRTHVVGRVECDVLGGTLALAGGWIGGEPGPRADLDNAPDRHRTRLRLYFTDSVGHPLTLVGALDQEPGLDGVVLPWRGRHHLEFRLLAGTVPPGEEFLARVVGAGQAGSDLLEPVREVVSLRLGGFDPIEPATALARSGSALVGEVLRGSRWRERPRHGPPVGAGGDGVGSGTAGTGPGTREDRVSEARPEGRR
ncbi:MAG TPA: GMC family oxidoreductase [Kineosporiaceae bacterium]